MEKTNLVYFGSPDFSAEVLASLLTSKTVFEVKVVGVVTSPDAPTGRKQIITPSPVALLAEKHNLPIFKPTKLDDAHLAHLKLLKPDIFLVVSYGKIIPKSYLTTPTVGTFNLHFSLLPKYRGALPVSEAIRNGDTETGVTLIAMDEALDHGPIIAQKKVAIGIDDNVAVLTNKLTQAGITLLHEYLPQIAAENFTASPQDEPAATYTPVTKTHSRQSAYIPWDTIHDALDGKDAAVIHNLIRSNNPDPGSWTKVNNLEVKIIKTKLSSDKLIIETVQLPGRSPISWESFLNGHRVV